MMSQENARLRTILACLKLENARLLEREKKSIELIKELIANALVATFKATEAASLLKTATQSMSIASAQACLLSWGYQNDEAEGISAIANTLALQPAKLTLVQSPDPAPANPDAVLFTVGK